MNSHYSYIDDKGRVWQPFAVSYRHEVDDMEFRFVIWAIDHADAVDRLEYIKVNGRITGMIVGHY